MQNDLDKKLNKLKVELKDHTEKQINGLEKRMDGQINGLARIIADGFKNEREHFDKRLDRLAYSLDTREQIGDHEKRLKQVEHAVGLR